MKNLTKGMLIGSCGAVVAVGAAGLISHTLSSSLIHIALDTNARVSGRTGIKKLISGCGQMEYIDRICEKNEGRLLGGDCKRVQITSYDGHRLVGHLHRAENAQRTVICMHGWRTSWSRDFGTASSFFHRNSCNVLYAEQRGQGSSGGEHIGFGIFERHDCFAWINYINSLSDMCHLPIYLCGVSMGASTVLMATGLPLPPNVVGVVADCGYTSPQDIWQHVTCENLHIPYGRLMTKMVKSTCIRKASLDPSEYSTVEALRHCKVPVLFIHGKKDRFVPIEMTYRNFAACASEKRLFIVPTAEHGMSYFIDKRGYEAEIYRFWRSCDRRI